MNWNNLKNNSFHSSGLIRTTADDKFVDAIEVAHPYSAGIFSMNNLLGIKQNYSLLDNEIFAIHLDDAVRFLENVEDRQWILSKAQSALYNFKQQQTEFSIIDSILYFCPQGTNLLHPKHLMFVYAVKENCQESFYFTENIEHDNSVNALYFTFVLENSVTENKIEIWQKLASGKFWGSGSILYRTELGKFIEVQPSSWETINQKGLAVYGDTKKTSYHGSVWSGTELTNQKPVYVDTSFTQFRLKPDILQCINFLEQRERKFLLKAFDQAFTHFKRNFLMDFIECTIILSKPGHSLAMHNHYDDQVNTFTYVFSSKSSISKRSTLVVKAKNDEYIQEEYPDCEEFFFMISSDLYHGVCSGGDDDNYYLYFVFDGAKLKEGIHYDYNKCYRIIEGGPDGKAADC